MWLGRPNQGRVVRGLVVGAAAALVVGLMPLATEGQSAFGQFCKKVEPRVGMEPTVRECGMRFTAADRYVGIIIRLGRLGEDTHVGVELLDPDRASVWTAQRTISVPAGYFYPDWWMWRVLPVTADEAALAAENVILTAAMIQVEGKPVRERVGDWTLRIRLQRGAPVDFRFALQAAP